MSNYLYNGVELPALPKWDTKTYPCAVISRLGVISSQYKYWLRLFKEPYTMSSATISTYSFFNVPVGDVYLSCSCDYNSPTEWSELEETVAENENGDVAAVLTGTKIIWSTFDIMAGDTVVFEKNGELPETEDETPETVTAYHAHGEAWASSDHYELVNGQWVKRTAYVVNGGKWAKVLPIAEPKKEPVAYLYNGVRLPALSEWDKTTYPYAMIAENVPTDTAGTRLYILSTTVYWMEKFDIITGEHSSYSVYGVTDGISKQYVYDQTSEEWTLSNSNVNVVKDAWVAGGKNANYIWTNFDLLDYEENIILPASDPVPVYE